MNRKQKLVWGFFCLFSLIFIISAASPSGNYDSSNVWIGAITIIIGMFVVALFLIRIFRDKRVIIQNTKLGENPLKSEPLKEAITSHTKKTTKTVEINEQNRIEAGSEEWVEKYTELLKKKLPKHLQKEPFLPDDTFYRQYFFASAMNRTGGVHYMASQLFKWLGIDPKGCIIDFFNEAEFKGNLGKDTAGFYTKTVQDGKETEVILINAKHAQNPMAVGAVLAHELMHLYLSRLNLRLDDRQENELLTDLATILVGFPVLVINGMHYSNQWYITVILALLGRIYWRSEQLAFGYFKPSEYGKHAGAYFKERNIRVAYIFSFVNPTSRHFIPHMPFLRSLSPTPYIKALEQRQFKLTILQVGAVVVIGGVLLGVGGMGEQHKQELKAAVDSCKSTLATEQSQVNDEISRLNYMKTEMDTYYSNGDTDSYNNLVEPYNNLLAQYRSDRDQYNAGIDSCNQKVDQYNNSQ